MLTVADVCQLLRVSKSTVHHWCCAKRIPYYRLGGRVLFKREEIEAWLQAKRIAPIATAPRD